MHKDTDLIDNESITNHSADITVKNGFSFSSITRTLGVCLLVLSLLAISSGGGGLIIGSVIFLASLFAITSTHGVEISLSTNYIREYSSAFGIKSGKWQSTLLLPDICILTIGKTVTMPGGSMAMGTMVGASNIELDATKTEVYLMSANHRKRVLIKICKSKREADSFAQELAQKMNKRLAVFNPQISEQSKRKR